MPGVRAHTSQHEKDPAGTNPRGLRVAINPARCGGHRGSAKVSTQRWGSGVDLTFSQLGSGRPKIIRVPEGMTGIEPASPAWKAGVLATIRHSHGAKGGTRTRNLRFTRPLRYQLRHFSRTRRCTTPTKTAACTHSTNCAHKGKEPCRAHFQTSAADSRGQHGWVSRPPVSLARSPGLTL